MKFCSVLFRLRWLDSSTGQKLHELCVIFACCSAEGSWVTPVTLNCLSLRGSVCLVWAIPTLFWVPNVLLLCLRSLRFELHYNMNHLAPSVISPKQKIKSNFKRGFNFKQTKSYQEPKISYLCSFCFFVLEGVTSICDRSLLLTLWWGIIFDDTPDHPVYRESYLGQMQTSTHPTEPSLQPSFVILNHSAS